MKYQPSYFESLMLSPWKFQCQSKQNSTPPGNSTGRKLCQIPWKFQPRRPKTKAPRYLFHIIFSWSPLGNSHVISLILCWKFHHNLNRPCFPVWLFSEANSPLLLLTWLPNVFSKAFEVDLNKLASQLFSCHNFDLE